METWYLICRPAFGYLLLALLGFPLTAPAPVTAEDAAVVDAEVRAAATAGTARVLVQLRLAGGVSPEGDLPSTEAVATQRRMIEAAEHAVVARLAGTRFSISRRYASVPILALEVGADALAALESMSDFVSRVSIDGTRTPTGAPR
jgi:hypothetical protein